MACMYRSRMQRSLSSLHFDLIVTLVLLICCLRISSAQQQDCDCASEECQNGDVRLNKHDDFQTADGVLEIYFNLNWMPVCYDDFNEGAAAAACRQLGYCTFDSYRTAGSYLYPGNTSYNTSNSCPSTGDYAANGELHLLRCPGQIQQGQCTPVFLNCKDCKSLQYTGEVSLLDNADNCVKSTGTLYLYYNNQQLPVCADNFNQFVADSACRQLGYTGAANYTKLPDSQLSWNLSDISTCQNKSYPCLITCSTSQYSRTSCRNFVITCKFDPDQMIKQSSGTSEACTAGHQESGSLCNLNKFKECVGTYATLGFLIAVILLFNFGFFVCWYRCWYKHKAGGCWCFKHKNSQDLTPLYDEPS